MSDVFDVTDEVAAHYNSLREARGWSWELLAEDFERSTMDPASLKLAEWARSQSGAKRGRKGAERTSAEPPEKR
jgi:hypothetical protein